MRVALAWRQTVTPVIAVVALMALYCVLVGSDRSGGLFALTGVALLATLVRIRPDRPGKGGPETR